MVGPRQTCKLKERPSGGSVNNVSNHNYYLFTVTLINLDYICVAIWRDQLKFGSIDYEIQPEK